MKKEYPPRKTFFLLFVLMFFFNGLDAYSQTLINTIAFLQQKKHANQASDSKSISQLLSEARKVFDVDFVYESNVVPQTTLVMNVAKYKTVESFLNELLKPYNLKYKKVLSKAYVIYANNEELKSLMVSLGENDENINAKEASDSSITVTGRITSQSKGEPLDGVSVTIKGTTKGTVTDKEGFFSINVPGSSTILVFSMVGFQAQEMYVGNKKNFQIALATQNNSMDEVVVIGYGTQKKSVVTGAISKIKASDFENMPVNRIEQTLQGRTSGLTVAASSGQPGDGATVRIRGTTSTTSSDPLYIVDGLPFDGGIENINQSDIESIEVLKDAASAAIYGARASAGVILVTTKKGRSGAMQVNYNGYYGTQAPAKRLKLLNATEYATLRNEASVNDGNGIIYADPSTLGKGTDWQDAIFSNHSRIQNHEVSISGGGEKSTYFASFGLFDQQGIVAPAISKYDRFSVRFNSAHKIKSWLNFGNNIAYAYAKNVGIGNTNNEYGGPLSSAINLDPLTPVVITDPSIANQAPYSKFPVVRDEQGRPYGISQLVQAEMTNPLAYIQTRLGNYGYSHNIMGNVYVEVEPIKGLKVRSDIGGKQAFWGSESYTPVSYLSATNYTQYSSYYREANQGLTWNWENTASYSRSFGLHNVSVMVGTSAYKANSRAVATTYQSDTTYTLPYKNFDDASLNYAAPQFNKHGNGWEGVDHMVSSLFGRITYNYAEKYLFTGIIRRDGSSRFGSNNKYGYFPSASLGWVASKENFWPVNNVVNFLKIRGSYGVTGNDNIGDFKYVSTVSGGRNYDFGSKDVLYIGYSPNGPANPDLKWEQTTQTNVGFEATLFKALAVTFDWYTKKTTGMLRDKPMPMYMGTGNPTANIGTMKNSGVELELGYHKQIGQVAFDIKANGSYLKNRVTYLGDVTYYAGATFQSSQYEIGRIAVGQPIGVFYGFKTLGIFQNQAEIDNYVDAKTGNKIQPNAKPGDFKYADLNHDGSIGSDDRTYIGDPTPKWSYGFTLSAAWKGFDILAFFQGAAGNKIYDGLHRLDIANANWTTVALSRWTGEGTSNSFPRMTELDPNHNFSNPSTFTLSDGSYMRLKTLQIGYTIPKEITGKISLQKVRVYVSSNNLFTFTKYTGFDPEIGGSSYGIDRGYYPQARSFMAGLNVGL